MTPVLFPSTATTFATNGLGRLSDAISCIVTEERNGKYELLMEYPMSGKHFSDIALRSIILAKPNAVDDLQPFRVYDITSPIGGIVTISAQHISYDMSGYPVLPFSANSASGAITAINTHLAVSMPFTLSTDISKTGTMAITAPASVRSLFGGTAGSLIDVYGGEWKFDKFTASLRSARGSDKGYAIRYGKNLRSIEQEKNCANVYTGVLPFWSVERETVRGNLVQVPGTFDFVNILTLDLTDRFTDKPTASALESAATQYINQNNIGVPLVSMTVSFANIGLGADTLGLCDTVSVFFEQLGVSTKAKVTETEWNVILDRYESINVGDMRTSIADTVASQTASIKEVPTSTAIQNAINNATALITGADGGFVVLHADANGKPYEILVMDTDNIDTAQKVWRWNKNGLGYSSNGYHGTYGLAMTIDGSIVADYINSGTINGDNVSVTNLRAENITAGYISANRIEDNSLSGDKITSMSGSKIVDNSLPGTKVTSMSGSKIQDNTLSGDKITSMSGTKIQDNTLNGVKIVSGSVTGGSGGKLSASTISTYNTGGGINTSLGYADYSNGVFSGLNTANYVKTDALYIGGSLIYKGSDNIVRWMNI